MKNIKIVLGLIMFNLLVLPSLFAQVPEKINYQAVARDLTGTALINATVNLTFEVLQGASLDFVAYSENQTQTTNQFGLFTAQIGGGTVSSGSFLAIDWGVNSYLRITVNGDVMPATQLLSVPYALYSKKSANAVWTLGGNNDIYNLNTGNVGVGTTAPVSTLEVAGSMGKNVLFANDVTPIFLDETSSGVIYSAMQQEMPLEITLPDASTCKGRIYHFTNVDGYNPMELIASNGNLIFVSNSSGATSESLFGSSPTPTGCTIISNGSDWYAISVW